MNKRINHGLSTRDKIERLESRIKNKKSKDRYDFLAEKELQERAREKEQERNAEVTRLERIEASRIKAELLEVYIDNKSSEELNTLWKVREDMLSTKLCCAKLLSKIRFLKGIDSSPVNPFSLVQLESIAELDLDDGYTHPAIQTESSKVRILSKITTRTKQSEFRSIILEAYGACAITGSKLSQALEAAHIVPFNGRNDTLKNGILLRADIHKLFDSFLLSINPKTKNLELNPVLESEYGKYRKVVKTTGSFDNLSWHYSEYEKLL
ncbi:hypothetical protein Sbal195_1981 [Shewanella baltica OS195]|uniref:HNH nuclease domain-containing protein n=1 Tax=Shewanella baltica (strain OS195) TaxID=399599 RepID=A9KZQ0_SHEB9|nr:HNH endonuclease [Shewanella baltica]ABX49152.1 hypothetical protein Sbal195_1981 [Shewanella baltica OS195]